MTAGRRFKPVPLAISRIGAFWLAVWKCWRLTLDWTVQLYLVLPGLFVGANLYRDAWAHPPAWFAFMTPQTVFALLGVLMLRARLRTFADPGDGLILRRNGRWTARMLAVGFAYTYIARLLLASTAVCLLIPVLSIRLEWSAAQGAALTVLASLLGFLWALVRDRLEARWRGWGRTFALWLARAVLMAAWVAAMTAAIRSLAWSIGTAAVLAVGIGLFLRRRALARGTFLRELAAESDAYTDCVGLLLRQSAGLPRKPVAGRGPWPILARRRLFRRREQPQRIAELWVKAKLRESDHLQVLIPLALLAAAALAFVPVGLAIAIWPVLGALALFWLHGQWKAWEEERYVAMLPWLEDALRRAERLGRAVFFQPLFGCWSLVLGAKLGWSFGGIGWLATLAVPAAGWWLGRVLNGLLSNYLESRARARARSRKEDSRNPEPPDSSPPSEPGAAG